MIPAEAATLPPPTFLMVVTSNHDVLQLAKQNSLHIQRKHSYFFINHIPGVHSAKSCVKIKHCFQIFFFLGVFFANFWVVLWRECGTCCVGGQHKDRFLNELEIR